MNIYQIHIDTINKVSGDPFNCSVLLKNSHRNVRQINLKNIQIPVGYYNIRAPYNVITINGTNYTMQPGNYTNTTSFINSLNTTVTPSVGTFSYSTTANLITFVPNSGSATILAPPQSLGNFIGFSNNSTGTSVTSTNAFQLNKDTYLNVYIPNLGTSSQETNMCTFKVPTNGDSTIYWDPNTAYSVKITDVSAKIDRLNISVLDRYGNPLLNNGLDWSFTIEVCSDT